MRGAEDDETGGRMPRIRGESRWQEELVSRSHRVTGIEGRRQEQREVAVREQDHTPPRDSLHPFAFLDSLDSTRLALVPGRKSAATPCLKHAPMNKGPRKGGAPEQRERERSRGEEAKLICLRNKGDEAQGR